MHANNEGRGGHEAGEEAEPRVSLGELRVRQWHPELPAGLDEQVRDLYERIGRFFVPAYETWEHGFCCDMVPERELAVWTRLARAFEAYVQKEHPLGVSKIKGEKLVVALVGFTLEGRITRRMEEYTGVLACRKLFAHYQAVCQEEGGGDEAEGYDV